ncbi:hypothetical protein NHQ30_000704 [Ciborinia camelliae]|nr:hypothetical protein NHQ30_000704 [Ciborinia camelliae]
MPKDTQHKQWLDAYYNQQPINPSLPGNQRILGDRPQKIADDCNAEHLPYPTTQGIDGVDSQIVGRHLSECQRRAAGSSRAIRMTPAQNQILDWMYEVDHYPPPGIRMMVQYIMKLDYKQVKNWIEQKAKNLKKAGEQRTHAASNRYATQMWKAYNDDPHTYVQKLLNGSICLVSGTDLTVPGTKKVPSAFTHGTVNNMSGHVGLGLMGHGTTIGPGLHYQPVNQRGQQFLQHMHTLMQEQSNMNQLGNQHGPQGFQHMHMEAQSQINNMPAAQFTNPVVNGFGVGPSFTADGVQQAGQQAVYLGENVANTMVKNAQPALQNLSDESSLNQYTSGFPANYRSAIPDDQSAFQNYQISGELQGQSPEQNVSSYQQGRQIQTEQTLNENSKHQKHQEFIAPSAKRRLTPIENETDNTQQLRKRPRNFSNTGSTPPYEIRTPSPLEGRMNNTQILRNVSQTISRNEFAAQAGKRKSTHDKDEIDITGKSKKRSQTHRKMKPLPSQEFPKGWMNNGAGNIERHTPVGAYKTMTFNDGGPNEWSPQPSLLLPTFAPSVRCAGDGKNYDQNQNPSQGSQMPPIIPSQLDPRLFDRPQVGFNDGIEGMSGGPLEAANNHSHILNSQNTADPRELTPQSASNGTNIGANRSPYLATHQEPQYARGGQIQQPTQMTQPTLEVQHTREENNPIVSARARSPAAYSISSQDGIWDLESPDFQALLPSENPVFPQNGTLEPQSPPAVTFTPERLLHPQDTENANDLVPPGNEIWFTPYNGSLEDHFGGDFTFANF